MEDKRIFFALDLTSKWDETEPPGRYIDKKLRHITLLFIGNISEEKLASLIQNIPSPSFNIAPSGILDKVLALPYNHPNVIAYRAHFLHDLEEIKIYKNVLSSYLESLGIFLEKGRSFLPHVTLCRKPFEINPWKKNFQKLPFYIPRIVLYESLENSKYRPLWFQEFILPFSEIEHTADIAFHIRGKDFYELYVNGFLALCFKSSQISRYFLENENIQNIDDVIISLNKIISNEDTEIGSLFKAVSFQSNVSNLEKYLQWEMIVDV